MSKKMSKKNIILLAAGGAAVVIAAVVILLVILLRPKTIDLNNYITVEYSGYNGYGTAEIVIDYDKMIDDMSEKLDDSEIERLTKGIKKDEKLTFKLDNTSNLSNGDTVKLDVKIKRSFFEEYKLELEVNTKRFEVSGLKDLTVMSPFDILEITYEGFDPYCKPILTNTSTDEFLKQNITFDTYAYEVAEGETFTVYAYYNSYEMPNGGYSMTETEKEYVATNVPQPQKFDPFDVLEITYEGYNPYCDPVLTNTSTDEFLQNNISFYTNEYDVAEGDSFTVYASYSSDYMINGGYAMTETEKEYVATNVPQPQEFDPFELLEYSFSGVEGDGDLTYDEKETDVDFLKEIWFSADKSYYLSSGDEITFTVKYYGDPERYGYKFSRTEMKVTVPALASYITDLSSVTKAHHDQMKTAALKAAQTYFDNGISGGYMYNSTSSFDYTYMSNFTSFTNLKVTNAYYYTYYSTNIIGYVISVDLGGNENTEANGTAYIEVEIKNPIILPDGTLDASFEKNITVNRNAYKTYDVMYEKDLQYNSEFDVISL